MDKTYTLCHCGACRTVVKKFHKQIPLIKCVMMGMTLKERVLV